MTDSPFFFALQLFGDNDPPNDPPTPKPGDPPAPKPNDPPKPPENDPSEDDLSKKTAAELAEYAKSLRRQNADYRTRAKTAATERDEYKARIEAEDRKKAEDEKRFQDIANEEKAKREKADAERDEARAEIARVKIFSEVRDQARALGLKNVRILDRLDMSSITLQDDGTIDDRDVINFVRGVKSDYPELFVDPTPPPDPPNPGDPPALQPPQPRPPMPRLNGGGDKIDWLPLTKEQFAAKERELLGGSSISRF